jgi:xylulokinase
MYSLGIDVGTSSVKVIVFNYETQQIAGSAYFPQQEMAVIAQKPGWAEQDPDWWWEAFRKAYRLAVQPIKNDTQKIKHIGIAYQMHGLVCLDKNGHPVRPSIIWCDSRAVEIGQQAFEDLGSDYVLNHLLNSPGNFTASKLAWVKGNEPDKYERVHKVCLPGDYIAYKLTGELTTTLSGISEGIFYDFKEKGVSQRLLRYFGFGEHLFPDIRESFDQHGTINQLIADELGLSPEVQVTYKAGDQPNNAFSLNVLEKGEVAATAGTSGVIYGVSDELFIDESQRVNSFAHVNYTKDDPRIGILLCINGTGIANSWARQWTQAESYEHMNQQAEEVGPGSEGLFFFPFGNGAERMLGNASVGSSMQGLNFNRHTPAHLYRAVQEGIIYSFMYGMEAFSDNQIDLKVIRAGQANMFLSPLFCELLSNLSGVDIELFNTDGALGAARGATMGAGLFSREEVFRGLTKQKSYRPNPRLCKEYTQLYADWKERLNHLMDI